MDNQVNNQQNNQVKFSIELYTVKETATILRVNYRKILDMIHLKQLSAYKIDGVYRIPIHAIHSYLEKVKTK